MKRARLFGLVFWATGSLVWAAEQRLTIDPAHSRFDVDVKVTMGLSFVGSLPRYDAKVLVDPQTMHVTAASLDFKFADVQTGEAKRDRHMNEWQETGKFPDARFELVSLKPAGDAGSVTATGRLTLHGQTQSLTFPVSILTEGHTLVLDGEAMLDTEQFGLPVIRKFVALKVDPHVTVRFHLQGSLPTE